MDPTHEQSIFLMISQAGNAKSFAFEALTAIEENNFAGAEKLLKKAKEELAHAHQMQTKLIQSELNGSPIEKSLLLIHAQDHLMTAISEHQLIGHLLRIVRKWQEKGSST